MSTGFILIIVGVILGGGALLFAIVNMLRSVQDSNRSFGNLFTGHLGAMAVMAIGGMIGFVGSVMVAMALLQKVQ